MRALKTREGSEEPGAEHTVIIYQTELRLQLYLQVLKCPIEI